MTGVGDVLRQARVARRWNQRAVGDLIGYSASWVSRVENGEISAPDEVLATWCDVLDVPVDRVGLECDDVRRRTVIGLGLGAVAGAAFPVSASADDSERAIEAALFSLPDPRPATRAQLAQRLAAGWDAFHQAHYADVGRTAPQLIADALYARARDIGARAYVLVAQTAIKNSQPIAWIAAERARVEAEATGNPVVMGEAAHALAITMRHAGEYRAAVDQLNTAAARVNASVPEENAMRATLLLTAAYSAAQAGWGAQALDALGEAEEAAQRRMQPVRLHIPGTFGITQTRLFRISVHQALGQGEKALHYAGQVDLQELPGAERRGRMCMDVARVWRDLGEPQRCFSALRTMAQVAPEEVRRPRIKAMTSELMTLNATIDGLPQFARKIGVAAA
ncbi:helix-turn-helix domain-containing protein [Streptomyces echinatus]|uniref:helix-turn-helix domain-containing protein n=1 Tax=Streptomyces echinatus TaxID=67293 RepID=UPI0037A38452